MILSQGSSQQLYNVTNLTQGPKHPFEDKVSGKANEVTEKMLSNNVIFGPLT